MAAHTTSLRSISLITKVTTWLRPREPQHQHTRNPDRVDWTGALNRSRGVSVSQRK